MNLSNILTQTISAFFGIDAMYFAIAAIGLNVQFGYAGLLNFGQAGFMACGAYAVGMTAHYFHISFWWGIPIAIAFAVIFGLIMGVPTLRLKADYLAIVTIALAECVRLIARSVTFKKYFGGSDGINEFNGVFIKRTPFNTSGTYSLWPFASTTNLLGCILLLTVFGISAAVMGKLIAQKTAKADGADLRRKWIIWSVATFLIILGLSKKTSYGGLIFKSLIIGWILAAVLGAFVYMLMKSPWGRVIKGIREDEDAVRSLGKNVYSYKMQALILGGAIATFSGIMFSVSRGSVQPDNYSRDVTFYVLTALVLGGLAKVSGSIIGPMVFWAILQFVATFLNELTNSWGGQVEIFGIPIITKSSDVGIYVQIVIGLMLVLLMVFRPEGMFGNRKEMALDGR